MPIRSMLVASSWMLVLASPVLAQNGSSLATLDDQPFTAPKAGARAEVVEGHTGKAVRFRFETDARSAFFTSNIRGTPEWDRSEGFSFWVKGDGTNGFGGLQFIYDEDYALRYDLAFPIRGTAWTKITVAWSDLIPVLPHPRAQTLDAAGGNPPSKVTGLWIGKWWYWGESPALSFALDEFRLEPKVDRGRTDHRPSGEPLARVRSKLSAGQPITVVTMGDSLTDKRHWANRETAWVDLFKQRGLADHRSVVTILNPAIGGTQLRQNLVLMPLWLEKCPEPDLVTVFFGGNDWDAGMRGEEFERACSDAVDRIRRATNGKADVLLMTTNPAASRWDATAELAEACRKSARDRNAGLADTDKAFRDAANGNPERLFVNDRVHLSREGHEVVTRTVFKAIETGGK